MSDVVYRHYYELKDLPGSARVTIFDGERTALIYLPGGQIEHIQIQARTLTDHAPDVHEAAEQFQTPALKEGFPADFHAALAAWLAEQAEDDGLEEALIRGSLDSSPAAALIAELIRRASE